MNINCQTTPPAIDSIFPSAFIAKALTEISPILPNYCPPTFFGG
jgi:hypothetical protein